MNEALATVLIAMLGGAIRVSTPFMFVALGECLTEKSGRVNLGLEGTLVLGAMVAYAASYHTGSPWFGILAAGIAGSVLGAMHGSICKLPKVNDVAVGIAMMLFGTGVAFFFGKPYIQPTAPRLPSLPLGGCDRELDGEAGLGSSLCRGPAGGARRSETGSRAGGAEAGRLGRVRRRSPLLIPAATRRAGDRGSRCPAERSSCRSLSHGSPRPTTTNAQAPPVVQPLAAVPCAA